MARDPCTDLQTDASAKPGATEQTKKTSGSEAITQMYRSLSVADNCIRLLQIRMHDRATVDNAPLDCRLYVADLSATPSYTALSYVWGKEISLERHILCNGIAIPVTNNCYSALQHLHAAKGTFDIWVDAVCINQKDQDEKMHQIRLMGDIFSQAKITYVWLGPGDAATNRVVGFLGRVGFLENFFDISATMEHILKRPSVWRAYGAYLKGRWGLRKSTVPRHYFLYWSDDCFKGKDCECTYDELLSYFNSSWITRIWTYQEVVLSPNPIVVCGDTHISWERLKYSVVFLASICPYSRFTNYDQSSNSSNLQQWVDTMSARELYREGAKHTTDYESPIIRYWKFCRCIHTMHLWHNRLSQLLALGTSVVAILPPSISIFGNDGYILAEKSFIVTVYLGVSFVIFLVFEHLVPRLAPNPLYSAISKETLARMEGHIRSDLHERTLHTLIDRNATEPRDMSFGLRSVLEMLPDHTDLPTIDHKIPLSNVYEQLTRFLLHSSKSLRVLTLAARQRCQNAPSWVPDYSRVAGADSIDVCAIYRVHKGTPIRCENTQKDADMLAKNVLRNEVDMVAICAAIYGSQLPYRYHPNDASILVVKGTSLECITVIKRHSVREESLRIETASYKGLAFEGCRIGDKLVLLVGLRRPLVVREYGGTVKIIGSASLYHRKRGMGRVWYYSWRIQDYMKYGETWSAHEKKRKEDWKREHGWSDSDAEPHPPTYLQDILIS